MDHLTPEERQLVEHLAQKTSSLNEAKTLFHQLKQRVDEIVFYKWDPLDFSGSNWPRDEYARYVDDILLLAIMEESSQPLAEHLSYLTTFFFEMPENKEHDIKVADLIFSVVNAQDYYPDLTYLEVD